MMNVPSVQVATMDYVEPFDLDNSYLWHKLQGTQAGVGGSGAKMPKSGSLTDDQLDIVRLWIEGGALP